MTVEAIGKCKACGEMKALARYQKEKGRRFYFRKFCVVCWSAERSVYQTNYRAENADRLAAYHQHKHLRKRDERNTASKRHYRKLQDIVFSNYGNKCACCGEAEPTFLSIDHVNNDGAEHRKKIGIGHIFYRWIIDHDFPDTMQLLCCNCNMGKHRNGGICPHQADRLKAGAGG